MEETEAETAGIGSLLAEIKGLHDQVNQSVSDLRRNLDGLEKASTPEALLRRADYWQVVIAYDSCVRLRLIIENNFHVIETLALLATTRYIFELSIWLVYYGKLLEKEREHCDGMIRQLQREIELLERFDERDRKSILGVAEKLKDRTSTLDGDSIQQLVRDSRSEVDREAARTFSLYADQAKRLGFGYTAHLVRIQALKKAEERHAQAVAALLEFRGWCAPESLILFDRRWKWDREAKAASMEGAYDFLYSYTSRLLHATPASVTTDVKNLEPDEIRILLRYIHGALLDALDLTSTFRVPIGPPGK
jgi:hypothetical protein